MTQTVITVENLSKRYLVGHQNARHEKHNALRDVIAREASNFSRKVADVWRGRQIVQGDTVEEFWALRNVSFEVKQGEVIGIIGRNGAGKSTLLKILSRITDPTEGRAVLRGRIASLLEVGTGFHSELSGRENIFLNGAILGMKHQEIREKFDEIVAFAEVERFLDTPVKHYSSGMYVRLAFAVAAHLEPDILIVDEVLAVGDAEFQKKCLGKIDEISHRQGRTILFVTHNMEAMLKICNRAILLHDGHVQASGNAANVLSSYFESELTASKIINLRDIMRGTDFRGRATLVEVRPYREKATWSFLFGEDVGFELSIDAQMPLDDVEIAVALYSTRGFEIASWTNTCTRSEVRLSAGPNTFRIIYQDLLLLPGQYYLGMAIGSTKGVEDYIANVVQFEVVPSDKGARVSTFTLGGAFVPRVAISKVE